MPDFDVFSLLDVRKRNGRSHSKRKNGNLKHKRKNKTVWTLADLCKILKSGRHQMLSKLSSLSIASLYILDEEAYKFYARMIENTTSIKQLFLHDVTLDVLFDYTLTRK